MKYTSTRGHDQLCSAAEAIRTGIAADGGLFVPIALPGLDLSSLCAKQGYVEIATAVLGALLTDYKGEELRQCAAAAYADQFDNAARIGISRAAFGT